jgi:hypothetical protein
MRLASIVYGWTRSVCLRCLRHCLYDYATCIAFAGGFYRDVRHREPGFCTGYQWPQTYVVLRTCPTTAIAILHSTFAARYKRYLNFTALRYRPPRRVEGSDGPHSVANMLHRSEKLDRAESEILPHRRSLETSPDPDRDDSF